MELGTSGRDWDDNIKNDFTGIKREFADWIYLYPYGVQWQIHIGPGGGSISSPMVDPNSFQWWILSKVKMLKLP